MKQLISQDRIRSRIPVLGSQISHETDPIFGDLTVVVVLKGAIVFAADLIRTIIVPIKSIVFVRMSSYQGTDSLGEVVFKDNQDVIASLVDQNVLIIEDIVDTGLTLNTLKAAIESVHPGQVRVAALLEKHTKRRKEPLKEPALADYVGFHIEDHFVVGYGMDYNGMYRNLPDIYIFDPKKEGVR